MHSYAGQIAVATPALLDPNFWRTLVLILHHDEGGTIGVVLNRPTTERVDRHLSGWASLVPEPGVIHYGGPVEPQVAIALLAGDDGDPTGLDGLSLGDVSSDEIPSTGLARIYSGYAGWSSNQLESEIAEGSWYVVEARPDDPFESPANQWERVLRRQNGHLALMSTFPVDVGLN